MPYENEDVSPSVAETERQRDEIGGYGSGANRRDPQEARSRRCRQEMRDGHRKYEQRDHRHGGRSDLLPQLPHRDPDHSVEQHVVRGQVREPNGGDDRQAQSVEAVSCKHDHDGDIRAQLHEVADERGGRPPGGENERGSSGPERVDHPAEGEDLGGNDRGAPGFSEHQRNEIPVPGRRRSRVAGR